MTFIHTRTRAHTLTRAPVLFIALPTGNDRIYDRRRKVRIKSPETRLIDRGLRLLDAIRRGRRRRANPTAAKAFRHQQR